MDNGQDDPRQHIDDWEWLYQHGYLDGTTYAAARKLSEATHQLFSAIGQATGLTRLMRWLLRRG